MGALPRRAVRQARRENLQPSHQRQEEIPPPGAGCRLPSMPCRGTRSASSGPARARASLAARSAGSVQASSQSLFAELAIQPRSRPTPFSLDRSGREVDKMCDLLDAETAEVPQLDDLCLSWIEGSQVLQRLIDSDHFRGRIDRDIV